MGLGNNQCSFETNQWSWGINRWEKVLSKYTIALKQIWQISDILDRFICGSYVYA